MEFRVTVGLGQDSVDAEALEARAAALQEVVTEHDDRRAKVVVVDLVKATVQLVLPVHAQDALAAAVQAVKAARRWVEAAGLTAPASIVTLEAEAVPAPAQDHQLRPHPVAER